MRIVISSGHGKYVRGASGLIDEVDEARRVVPEVAQCLRDMGHEVEEFHDDVSQTQNENLNTIVEYHNSQERDLDVSVHFNAYTPTDGGRGTEVLYVTQEELADRVSYFIADAGQLINRGAHKRTDLFFLNNTSEPAILIEVCFVDAKEDVTCYQKNFELICSAIAEALVDEQPPVAEVPSAAAVNLTGKVSWFGGPMDKGVSSSEGLAFIYDYDDAPGLFLKMQPPHTTGLARRLNPAVYFVACRWDYDMTPKDMLADQSIMALVKSGERQFLAHPADWGPHQDTNRVADISQGLMAALGIETDDEVTVIYPAPEG